MMINSSWKFLSSPKNATDFMSVAFLVIQMVNFMVDFYSK